MKRISFWILFIFISNLLRAQEFTIYLSHGSVDETASLLIKLIKEGESLILFETVCHDSIAKNRGIEMAPVRSILFEDPDLSTSLINCQPTAASDLPMELLVWEENDDVFIGFVDPNLMKKRFMVKGCDDTLHDMSVLMIRLVNNALRQL